MSHTRNATRFLVVLFWAAVVGVVITAATHSGNWIAVGWSTWLLYAAISVPTVYVGYFTTRRFWSIK